ncbi:hypothetical protein M0R45_000580 [Rubus argutus]|uniref:Uncharacterized protein n=1 Tax=Rubus argutus TaxID=59490 RepID=A0AAW1VP50_RUBAR
MVRYQPPHLFSSSTTFSLLYSTLIEDEGLAADMNINAPLCSSISNGTICCDRSSIRSDICIMKGDLIAKRDSTLGMYQQQCDVQHNVPAVFSQLGAIPVMFIMNSMMGFCHCTLLPSISTRRLSLSFRIIIIGGS